MARAPSPRSRVRPVQPAAPAPEARPRVRPVPHEEHGIYEPFDGPERLAPSTDPVTGNLRSQNRSLIERVDLLVERDKEEAETLMFSVLHQYILANTPIDVIAERMSVSVQTVKNLRTKLYKKLREDMRSRDPIDFISRMMAELEEVKAKAWQEVALAPSKEWGRRMRALDAVMKSSGEIGKLLQVAGLYDNSPLRAAITDDGTEAGEANILKDLSAEFLTALRGGLRPGDTIIDQ